MVEKKFEAEPTVENFEEHVLFLRTSNANLSAVNAAFDDHLLAWNLIHSLRDKEEPFWSVAITNIVTTATPVNQWSFDDVADKLCEAVRSNGQRGGKPPATTGQAALTANTSKPGGNRYSGTPCTHPGCPCPKSHGTDDCWTKESEEQKKKKEKGRQKAKKAKKKASVSSSGSETGSDSGEDSEPPKSKRHRANRTQVVSGKTTRALKASLNHGRSYHGKTSADTIFIAHPDSGASNHMCHKLELFDSESFETLAKPIPISLGDDSEIFATGKGTIRLIFNVDRQKKEGKFSDVLFVPDLKVTLLSVGQSARLPHCKVVFDNNICEYIDKNTNEVIARARAFNDDDLYTLEASPVIQKVDANVAISPIKSINVNILHRRLGHLGFDNCRTLVNRRLIDGVDKITGSDEFCEGCTYGRSRRKHHPTTDTKTKRRLERVHIDLCGPLPNSIGGNRYFLLIIDEHTHYHWVEFLPKKSDAFARLQRWKLQAERESDLKLRYLKSDGGMEFGSKAFGERA